MAKSWDIQPNKRPALTAQQKPTASAAPSVASRRAVEPMVRRSALQKTQRTSTSAVQPKAKQKPEPIKTTVVQRTRVPQGRAREPLKDRRKRARRILRTVLAILFVCLIGAVVSGLWLPAFRVQSVTASGPNSTEIKQTAESELQGQYYFIIPRNSIFFIPTQDIRHEILIHYPNVSALSISRTSLQSINLSAIGRDASFVWCGTSPDATGATLVDLNATTTQSDALRSPCFVTDSQGYVFAPAGTDISQFLRIYGQLTTPADTPIGGRLASAAALPNAIQFVKSIKNMDVPIVSLAFRSDEADLYTQAGTKITYVLGHENAAAQLAQSAFSTLSLNDGSLEYVDLRFTDKVYFKKKGETEATASSTQQ